MGRYQTEEDSDWRPLVTTPGKEVWQGNRGGKWFGPIPGVIDASAPMHDSSRDKAATGPSLTPKSVWDATFRNRFTGDNPLSPPQAPSLSTLAAGGQNHAQKWMTPEQGQQSVQKYMQPGPITAPAFTSYDSTPGTRRPFIAGANGVNVGPSIAAKVNPNDPTLDKRPEWMQQFSWSSAFNR